ncbi:MAG TPA: GNAT family N-acetyltransferase, partial [Chthoniobacterales bacterium]|nr:GNAT family N-acetyltransferase [Chthoniobacterales bacterium]
GARLTNGVETTPETPNGVAEVVSRSDLGNLPEWQQAFRDRCKHHRYYEIVADTLTGFEHHFLLLKERSGSIRAIQPFFFVTQNLVEGIPGPLRSFVDLVRKFFPRFLTMRTLMVGCAAGEGHLGTLATADDTWVAETLRDVLPEIAQARKASLIVLKDFPSAYREALRKLRTSGFARVPSMPLTRLSLNHNSFDDFFATLSKATRKDLRRKFRKADRAPKIDMEVVSDITPHIDEVYPLYLAVHNRSPMKFETLTKDYFRRISRDMPDRARFFIWRQQGKIIAFSLTLLCGDTIYDECLGMDYAVAFKLSLYFYTLRDVLAWAIQQRIKYYYSTPLNYEPKLHLHCELVPLDLYARHTSPLINPIFGQIVKFLGPTRHDQVLRRFPNADQL